jgi:hypothetical protein
MARGDDSAAADPDEPTGRQERANQPPDVAVGLPDAVVRMHSALAQVHAMHPATTRDGRAGRYHDLCQAGTAAQSVRGASLIRGDDAGGSTQLAASDPLAEQVADLGFTTGDGPARRAYTTGVPVLDSELDVHRWPLFAPAARQLGVRALFAFPLQLGAIRIGVLTLDHDRPLQLGTAQLTGTHLLLRACVAAVLADLDRDDRSPDGQLADGWLGHLDGNQDMLHQATGMVLVQLDSSAEVALLRLRAHAFATSRPVSEVAADIVARRLSFRQGSQESL